MKHRTGRLEAWVVRPGELDPAERAAWRAMQDLTPQFGNPLLGPDFAAAVGEVRDDARVAVFHRKGEPVGFLAFHRRPRGFARPIGAPLADYHALVCAPDDAPEPARALAAAGIAALRMTSLVDPFEAFEGSVESRVWAHRIVLDEAGASPLDELLAGGSNLKKNHRRYRRALEREVGEVRLAPDDRNVDAFETLMGWKREQFVRTGRQDVLAASWTAELMRRLFARRCAGFGGRLISLYAGDRLVAGHFGVRQNGWYHPWISAYDPGLAQLSPGAVHQVEAIAAMADAGLTTYDLGPSGDHWKGRFSHDGQWVGVGLATAPTMVGVMARQSERLMSPLLKAPMLNRIRNRLDHIAALEPTLGGRLQAVALGSQRIWKWAQ
ncbi:MAG TPA: GNAT family N-acetyltransferase [Caulobacteraceae bacterium]